MPLVKAICSNCNGILDVDNAKDAAICPYCGTPYIVEKAIQQYNIQNTNYIQNAVIVDTTNSESKLLSRGITQLELGVWKDAADTFQNMSKLYPDNYKSWLGMCIVAANYSQEKYDEKMYRKNTMVKCPENKKRELFDAKVYSDGRIKNERNLIKNLEKNKKFNEEQIQTLRRNIEILDQYRVSLSLTIAVSIIVFLVGVYLLFAVKEVGVMLAFFCAFIGVTIIIRASKPPNNVPENINSISSIDKELANQNSKIANYHNENDKNNEKINKLKALIDEERKYKHSEYFIEIMKS